MSKPERTKQRRNRKIQDGEEFRFVRRSSPSPIVDLEIKEKREVRIALIKRKIAEGTYNLSSIDIIRALLT
jgi:anti-sigma28 factor (negative regulator of flagellin synthesis)